MYLSVFKNKISAILFISAIYFILWSLVVLFSPKLFSFIVIDSAKAALVFWDFMGLITMILGIGLLISSFNPFKHWVIILFAALFHLAMIGGFIFGYRIGFFNNHIFQFILLNHVIWLVPNIIALHLTYKRSIIADTLLIESYSEQDFPLELFETVQGENIQELSEQTPIMLVFLRHFGCPFCKESLINLAEMRRKLEEEGIKIVLVYMSDPRTASPYLEQYQLNDLAQVSDPEEIFYKSFKLKKGNFTQLFGLKVWMRWVELAFSKKLFNTKPEGNVSQMPGVFLMKDGVIMKQYQYNSIADVVDYRQFLA